MPGILIFGGGDIAENGIVPVVGGTISNADVLSLFDIREALAEHDPETVINCAGISRPGTIADYRYISEIRTNLTGAFNVAALSLGRRQIHIASVAGLYGKPGHAGYSASKAGMISLVQSLGMEGEDAYAISPGRVDTQMREQDFPGEDPRTRLDPAEIGLIVEAILAGAYTRGDNIIVRRVGYDTTIVAVDKGEPWRSELRIGEPPLV